MKISRWMLVAGALAVVVASAFAGSLGVAKTHAAAKTQYAVALVSDVAGFNDNGFNKNQLKGLNEAKSKLGIAAYPIVSHSPSDYQPNYNTAVHDKANLIIAAGFLLDDTMNQYATKYPKIKFAITDDVATKGYKNEEGITYATQEGGCLVGVLAAEMAASKGKKIIGVAGGLAIPPVDSYIAGYEYCAKKAVPGTKILVQYSNDFETKSKCAAIAQNEIGQGAQVIFQVAGLCGDGALTQAGSEGKWGIGVDADEYNVSPGHILTSALKKTDVGVYDTIKLAKNGGFKGGTNLLFNLKNSGVGVGQISPKAKPSWITLMNQYKAQIIKGTLKPPAACPNNKC